MNDAQTSHPIDPTPPSRREVIKTTAALAAGSVLAAEALAGESPRPARRLPRLTVRRSADRGRARHGGWLDARHTFSFGSYTDRRHMGFRALRVINEDRIAGGGGFPMHPHKDMEIVTYVLDGALEHKDSLRNGGVIRPGDIQRMSAGTGIWHSEFNPSRTDKTHLLQIWMLPSQNGIRPSYEQATFQATRQDNRFQLLASPTGASESVKIQTNVNLWGLTLKPGQRAAFRMAPQRHAWIQVARGNVAVNGTRLAQGDGARTSDAGRLTFATPADKAAELLLFDLA